MSNSTGIAKNSNLSNAGFGNRLSAIQKNNSNLHRLSAAVYNLKKDEQLIFPDGRSLGRKEIKAAVTLVNKDISALKVNYVAHGKGSRKPRKPGSGGGFLDPVLVRDELRNFFINADFGPENPTDPTSAPLSSKLSVGQTGVISRGLITALLSIYANVHGMQQDDEEKQYLTATPEMDKYFSAVYPVLIQDDIDEPRFFKKDKNGVRKPIPRFDPKHFRYADFQRIIKPYAMKKEELTKEQFAQINTDKFKKHLKGELKAISEIGTWYRWDKAVKAGKTKLDYVGFAKAEADKKEKKRQKKLAQYQEVDE